MFVQIWKYENIFNLSMNKTNELVHEYVNYFLPNFNTRRCSKVIFFFACDTVQTCYQNLTFL